MKEILLAHGWSYLKECTCASPGSIYMKGKNKITIYSKTPKFLLIKIGNVRITGSQDDLDSTLTKYGL